MFGALTKQTHYCCEGCSSNMGRARLCACSMALLCTEVFSVPPHMLHPYIKAVVIVLLQCQANFGLTPLAAVSNVQNKYQPRSS